jgi:hypothetical protein
LPVFVPREAQSINEQSNKAVPTDAPRQNASGNGNIQIAQANNVHISTVSQPAQSHHAEKLADFIVEAQKLRERLSEDPLPIKDHNDWVSRVENYLEVNLNNAYKIRLRDFSGMTFYGDNSERSKMSKSLEGSLRRLHEFISEMKQ